MAIELIVVDFETFYDRSFSLSKLTPEEYIRDELFEVIGISVKLNDAEPEWFSGTMAQTKRWLQQWPWENAVAVAHNAPFDMAILNWHFDIRPKRIADTLSMARALDGPDAGNSLAKLAERHGAGVKGDEVVNALGKGRLDFTAEELSRYGEYCINDVVLTHMLFLKMLPRMPQSELRLIDATVRMFTEPTLTLDKGVLTTHLAKVKARKEELLSKALVDKDDIMSNPKLAALLDAAGVTPPTKISPTTGKETYAFAKTDEAFKDLLEHPNPVVQAIVACRLGIKSTLEETRTERFIGIAERGTLPVPLRYYAAHTGRWGGDDKLNLQNLPRKSPLKKAILAPEGYRILDADSSQIEARTLAWLAGQQDLVELFEKNNAEIAAGVPKAEMQHDPYKTMASMIYSIPVASVTPEQRQVGKVVLLGAGYGLGWRKFVTYAKQQQVQVTDQFAERIISTYREAYPMIPALWKEGDVALRAMLDGYTAPLGLPGVLEVNATDCDVPNIKLPNGLHLRYPNLRRSEDPDTGKRQIVYDTKRGRAVLTKNIFGASCAENYTQALARIIVGEQLLMVARRYKVVLTVHDSVGALIPLGREQEGQTYVEDCMRIRPKWAVGLPLNCESHIGASYGG
jgi:DNA polymerase